MAKVLVIDDDPAARQIMAAMLKQVGHEPHACGGLTEAIHTALTFKPDVLVTDWLLKSSHTGLEIAEALRASHPNIGLVFITGLPDNKVVSMARNLHPYRVVHKPCEFYQLFEAVQEVIPQELVSA